MAEELARKELLLRELVVTIANRTGLLLELVNYNVEGTYTTPSAVVTLAEGMAPRCVW